MKISYQSENTFNCFRLKNHIPTLYFSRERRLVYDVGCDMCVKLIVLSVSLLYVELNCHDITRTGA